MSNKQVQTKIIAGLYWVALIALTGFCLWACHNADQRVYKPLTNNYENR